MWTASGATFIPLDARGLPCTASRRSAASCSPTVSLRQVRWSRSPSAAIFLESYPALFGGVGHHRPAGRILTTAARLYLRVLGDLWGQGHGAQRRRRLYQRWDLAATSLTPAERSGGMDLRAVSQRGADGAELRAALRGGLHQRPSRARMLSPQWEKGIPLHHHRNQRSGHIQSAQPLGGWGNSRP